MRRGLAAALLLAGCAGAPRPVEPIGWRTLATADDRDRLRGWRDAWLEALGRVRAAGDSAAIGVESALFDPDRAIAGPIPPAGPYRCRLFMLGANGAAREFTSTPAFPCEIGAEGAALRFVRPSGQQVVGRLYPDTASRAVFLGTLEFADERAAPRYGRDAGRDVAGLMERVDDRRWRLTLPRPRFEAVLDVVEIVPAA